MTRYCRYCQVRIATHLLKVFAMPADQTLHTAIVFSSENLRDYDKKFNRIGGHHILY